MARGTTKWNQLARPIALAMIAGAFCLAAQVQEPPLPKAPAQIAHWLVEDVWNKGDFRLADRMFTSGAVLHFRGHSFPLTAEVGLQTVKNWRNAFPDFHFTLEDMIVEGNKVVLRIPFTGTHQGRFWGVEPTGRKVNVTEILIIRIEDDKIAEMWEDFDEYGMRIQLGLLPAN